MQGRVQQRCSRAGGGGGGGGREGCSKGGGRSSRGGGRVQQRWGEGPAEVREGSSRGGGRGEGRVQQRWGEGPAEVQQSQGGGGGGGCSRGSLGTGRFYALRGGAVQYRSRHPAMAAGSTTYFKDMKLQTTRTGSACRGFCLY